MIIFNPGKIRSIVVLALVEVTGMSLWFVTAAILPDMLSGMTIDPTRQALMSSAVQAGFVVGALSIAASGVADIFDPRRVLALSALLASFSNAALIWIEPGSNGAILLRFVCGFLLAGVYPVGMKIAVGWGLKDRGLLVGLIVGSLTLGKSLPYLWAYLNGADWRSTIVLSSLVAGAAGVMAIFVGLGPHHARAARFSPGAILLAWRDRRIRLAYFGYFGHMWELYAMWSWVSAAAAASFVATMPAAEATALAKMTTFCAIGLGGGACILAGFWADRIGKAQVALAAMCASGAFAVLSALSFGGPAWLTVVLVVGWGLTVIPDSAQFSALVADHAPAQLAGSLLSLQTALGFMLTIAVVQAVPMAASWMGWPVTLALMALGPCLGVVAMSRLIVVTRVRP